MHELLEQHQKFKRTLTQRKANLQYKLKKLRFRTLCQTPIIMICLNADVVILWTRSVLTIHLKEDTDTMTDTTEQFVLMKCKKCGYAENVPIHDILILRQLSTPDDTKDHLLCLFCLHDMYRIDSNIIRSHKIYICFHHARMK